MKRNRKHPRQSANLSEAFRQRLNNYALAAGAAGVSLLASASTAGAQVGFTPENIVVRAPSLFDLNFNDYGPPEFSFLNDDKRLTFYTHLDVFPLNGTAAVVVSATNLHSVLALTKGSKIGSSRNFQACLGTGGSSCISGLGPNMVFSGFGNWVNVKDRYVGLRFQVSDGTHYGWARFSVQVNGTKITAWFTGYAYEETLNTPIVAGDTGLAGKPLTHPRALLNPPLGLEPGSHQPALGILALGAPGIPFWRNEPASATK